MPITNNLLKVFFFGDSICFGQGVSPHKTWVSQIASALDKCAIKQEIDIIVQNPSINGNTTRQALERMAFDVQSHEPDLVLVQFGMNDCNYWQTAHGKPRVSQAAFKENLIEIITCLMATGAKKIILQTNHPSGRIHEKMSGTDITYQQSNKQYNNIIRDVSNHLSSIVTLNDIEKFFEEKINHDISKIPQYLLDDLLHLSEQGHALYFDATYNVVLRCVQELFHNQTTKEKQSKGFVSA